MIQLYQLIGLGKRMSPARARALVSQLRGVHALDCQSRFRPYPHNWSIVSAWVPIGRCLGAPITLRIATLPLGLMWSKFGGVLCVFEIFLGILSTLHHVF